MHRWTPESDLLAEAVAGYARRRLSLEPPPLGGALSPAELERRAGPAITEDGIGAEAALALFETVLAPACTAVDSPRFLSFIPGAPTIAAALFDLAVSASSIYGGSWLEGAGAVHAENEALRWLAGLAGFPPGAGGVFVQGGTLGNLSALVAARCRATAGGAGLANGGTIVVSTETHSSVRAAAAVMGAGVLEVATDGGRRLTGDALRQALADHGEGVFAVVATAGTTNLGVIDDLAGVAAACEEHGAWLHVDGAYGLAALAAPSARSLFAGIERADSFVVDPHKWLFAPFDCCALVYRDPEAARRAHAQAAGYLEPLRRSGEWDPADYAVNLTRRARGLPFWFSLAVHGTRAYGEAIERTLSVARAAAAEIRRRPSLELLLEPALSVVAFRRLGWRPEDYEAWSRRLAEAGEGFVLPTVHDGETVTRMAFVNPRTSEADVRAILDTMEE